MTEVVAFGIFRSEDLVIPELSPSEECDHDWAEGFGEIPAPIRISGDGRVDVVVQTCLKCSLLDIFFKVP